MTKSPDFLPSLTTPILQIPLKSDQGRAQPLRFETSDGELILAFSSPLALARFFGDTTEFTEMAPQAILAIAMEEGVNIGFDLEEPHAVILDQDTMREISRYLSARDQSAETNRFEIIEKNADIELLDALKSTLDSGEYGYVFLDKNLGWVFLLVQNSEQFVGQDALRKRQVMSQIEHIELINYMVVNDHDARFLEMKDELESKAKRLDQKEIKAKQKPPILKY